MAIQSAIPVSFEAFFPRGAFVVGEVEPIVKWSDDGQRQGQDLDKNSGYPLWQVRVIDADPDAKKGQGEVTIKIASISEPQLPPELNGLPFRPDLRGTDRHALRQGGAGSSASRLFASSSRDEAGSQAPRG